MWCHQSDQPPWILPYLGNVMPPIWGATLDPALLRQCDAPNLTSHPGSCLTKALWCPQSDQPPWILPYLGNVMPPIWPATLDPALIRQCDVTNLSSHPGSYLTKAMWCHQSEQPPWILPYVGNVMPPIWAATLDPALLRQCDATNLTTVSSHPGSCLT